MRFYLAGGMRGRDWQSEVKTALAPGGHRFLDPCDHGLSDPLDYTAWDLGAVAISDGVISYMERTNPSGIGLTLELGMAIGMGKPTYFACESPEARWDLVNNAVSKHFTTLEQMISWLQKNLPVERVI